MLTVETIGRIRREFFVQGRTIKEIARDLRVSRNTVRRIVRTGRTEAQYERDTQPRLRRLRGYRHLPLLRRALETMMKATGKKAA